MNITQKIARRITLQDDATETGGVSFHGEDLCHFIQDAGMKFGLPLSEYNKALVECGIEPVTKEQVLDAANPFTDHQIRLLRRIAKYTKMDCWFDIDEYGQIRDFESDSRRPVNPRKGISDFIDGVNSDTFNQLNDEEKFDLLMAVSNVLRVL